MIQESGVLKKAPLFLLGGYARAGKVVWDSTQIPFIITVRSLGLEVPPGIGIDWHMKMWEGLEIKTKAPNYRYYVVGGGLTPSWPGKMWILKTVQRGSISWTGWRPW